MSVIHHFCYTDLIRPSLVFVVQERVIFLTINDYLNFYNILRDDATDKLVFQIWIRQSLGEPRCCSDSDSDIILKRTYMQIELEESHFENVAATQLNDFLV